jgi:hypothetical protein
MHRDAVQRACAPIGGAEQRPAGILLDDGRLFKRLMYFRCAGRPSVFVMLPARIQNLRGVSRGSPSLTAANLIASDHAGASGATLNINGSAHWHQESHRRRVRRCAGRRLRSKRSNHTSRLRKSSERVCAEPGWFGSHWLGGQLDWTVGIPDCHDPSRRVPVPAAIVSPTRWSKMELASAGPIPSP